MLIYVLSEINQSIILSSGQHEIGYYSTLNNAYNKLKKYIDNIPELHYIQKLIERNGYYDISDKYYTTKYIIKKVKLDT